MDRYERLPQYDKRIGYGDTRTGDAWRDTETFQIFWCAVGYDPNEQEEEDQ
jgi:hypothetical protein